MLCFGWLLKPAGVSLVSLCTSIALKIQLTGVARSKWESQSTFFEDCSLPVSHKSSSPGVKQEWLHRIHTETGRKIKKHLWACYCNITQVRSVGEAAGAAEKLVTSISTFSMRIPVGAPGSGDIP